MLFCPFHENSHTPALSIHLEEGVWHCFGCGEKGSLERLYKLMGERMDDGLYLQRMARRASEPETSNSPNLAPVAKDYCESLRGSERGRGLFHDYAKQRGILPEVAEHYAIGYEGKMDALALPYWDEEGRVTGIKFRHSDGGKSSFSGSTYGLYGLGDVLGASDVIICEGESDTHHLWGRLHGRSDIRVCGTSGSPNDESRWTRYALSLMFARRIWLAHDADDAGDACATVAMRVLGEDRCVRARPTRGKDICEHMMNGGSIHELGI
jgi:hypothetical protein